MSQTIQMPLNRVEGDLEIRVTIDKGVVQDAWAIGTMYRGIERMLIGRGSLDGLVITPRVCGICSTSHLLAAARALDAIAGVSLPANADAVRNLALMAEHLQSDLRHVVLMFAADLVNPAYRGHGFFADAVRRYQPYKGESVLQVVRESKRIPEIIAILGGQWPHSSFMVPGGITSMPSAADLRQCRLLLQQIRAWYERRVLGCPIERWEQVQSLADLEVWLTETAEQHDSELGFLLRACRELGLHRLGAGHEAYIAFPDLQPPRPSVEGLERGLVSGGFMQAGRVTPLQQERIAEQVGHSRYQGVGSGLHPFEVETRPDPQADEECYSWCKAPRYDGQPAETGPLAERVVRGDPLFLDLLQDWGGTVLTRELARLVRPALLLPTMQSWFSGIEPEESFYRPVGHLEDGAGFGMVQASRGGLGHWVQIVKGAIEQYQIITPTGWNASPRGDDGGRGPMEEALIGTPVADPKNPVEIGHVVRSFDPCLVCSVHAISRQGRALGRVQLGLLP